MDLAEAVSRGKRWNTATRERIAQAHLPTMDWADLRARGQHLNDAAMDRIAGMLPRRSPSSAAMLGMLALGLVVGAAIGGYAVSQRYRTTRVSGYPDRTGEDSAPDDGDESSRPVAVTTHRENHRRKRATRVSEP